MQSFAVHRSIGRNCGNWNTRPPPIRIAQEKLTTSFHNLTDGLRYKLLPDGPRQILGICVVR